MITNGGISMKRSTCTLHRLLALVLVLVMVGSLFAGCSKKDPDPTDPSETTGTTEQTAAPTDEPTEPTEEPTEEGTEPVVTVPPVTVGTVDADNLNVRSEPDTTADILKRLAINTRVEIHEQKIVDGVKWGRISEGWINMNYVTLGESESTGVENENNIGSGSVSTPTYGAVGTITASELNIRKEANDKSASVGVYKKGAKVSILEKSGDWGRTDKGWINLKYVNMDSTVAGSTGSSTGSSSTGSSSTTLVTNGKTTVLGYGIVNNVTSLAVRSGPGTSYTQLTYITAGQRLPYFQKSGNWVRIKAGWVSLSYFDTANAIPAGATGTVTATNLNIREKASSSSTDLGNYSKGDKVTILEVSGNWGRTDKGWVSLSYVTFDTDTTVAYPTGTGTVTAYMLNIRKEAKSDGEIVGTYKQGDKVTITETSGKWGKTNLGWISMKCVEMDKVLTSYTGTITASSLNIRDKASIDGEDIGSYLQGQKVTILEVSGNWGRTDEGWISLSYVKFDGPATYTVTMNKTTNGTIKSSAASAVKGATVTLTVTPAAGYELEALTVKDAANNGISLTGTTFVMPASNVTVTATFKKAPTKYTVTLNTPTGGTVSASSTSCAAGTQVALTVSPASGYVLTSLTAMNTTNNSVVAIADGKFTMPAGNVNVVATFEKTSSATYTVTVNSATNGSVTANTTSAVAGAEVTLTVTPATGYELDALSVKDAANNVVTVSGNKFTMPAANVTIVATFKASKYTVSVAASTNGAVSVNPGAYEKGATVSPVITPDAGYELDKLTAKDANGNDVTISGNKFTMPASNVTVSATFKKATYTVTVSGTTNGTLAAAPTSGEMGTEVTLTITPAAGYALDKLTVKDANGNDVTVSGNKFAMPTSNVTVTATFKYVSLKYKVTNSGNPVNIRKEASTTSDDLGDIPDGTVLDTLEGSTDSWIKVTYNSITGWVGTGNLIKVS